ncbi:MAG: RHS repeat domain-containing protein, partial [Thermoanaerobaculia bacterium]
LAQITTATGAIDWYFNDHLDTPILQTDAEAGVVWRVEYDPYGTVFSVRTGEEKHQPLRFPGQENDGAELSYNIFRWYRSSFGRFTQADPIGFESGDSNWYAYAGGNSVTFADPLGLAIQNPMDIYRDFRDRRRRAQDEFRGQSEMRHCVFSCRTARDYGSWLTRNAGFVNEAQGFFMHDLRMLGSRLRGDTPWAFQPDDLINNERGFACADRIEANPNCTTCETCCRESINRPRPTPPPVFPTSFGPCAKVNGQTVCAGTGI